MVDNSIIISCRSGDQIAYKKLYNACAPYIYAIIKNYFGRNEDSRDALQEVFAQIFLSIDRFDTEKGSFKSWVSRIAVHQCINILRKTNRLNISYSLEIAEEVEADTFERLEMFSESDLQNMLSQMPDGYRTIFLLSVIEEYTHKEIGEMLQISPDTSRSQLFRAIKWIKKNILVESNMTYYGLL